MKNYSKFMRQTRIINNKKIDKEKMLTREIIDNLKESEKEIDEGKVIPSKVVFEGLRELYGC